MKYKNKTYDSCIMVKDEKLWCATLVDETLNMKEYGFCKDSCLDNHTIKLVTGASIGSLFLVSLIIMIVWYSKKISS